MDILLLNEQRCKCGKLLFKGILFDGILEIKCKRCDQINTMGDINIVDNATHYLLVVDGKGKIINGSEAACYVLGYSHSELLGKDLSQISPITQKDIEEKFLGPDSVLGEENYFKLDTFHLAKSGKKIPVTSLLRLYRPTKKEKYLLISTEPKNSETKSNFFKKDSSKFLSNACDFYFTVDKKGTCEYVSPLAEEILGFPIGELMGKNYFDFLPTGKRSEAKEIFDYFSIDGEPYRTKGEMGISRSGKTICSQVYFTPNFNDMGKFAGYHVLSWLEKPKEKR